MVSSTWPILGAPLGGLGWALADIYTCQLNQANPFDYLTELQRHTEQVAAGPELWMPWNYRETLTCASNELAEGNTKE